MEPIVVSGVEKRYGPVAALRGVDLELRPGAVHCLAGPNGSGKTTLLRLLGGLARPTSGRVAVPDVETGYAFQRPNVYPDLTVEENLDVFGGLRGADAEWRAELVERLRLDAARHRPAGDLSDGFAKKLDLALALLAKPDLLLLDEPLADLDDLTVARLVALVDDYRAPDRLVVVSTHNVDRFAAVLDRLTVVLDGELVCDDAVGGTDPQATYERVLDEHAGDVD